MKTFTIDKKTWLHGEGHGKSMLLRPSDRKKCCLGFYLESCKVPEDVLRDTESPIYILHHLKKDAKWLISEDCRNSADANTLMALNDNTYQNESERRKEIGEIFRKHDICVIFK